MRKSVAVFGAGIAGLTVAHELSLLGYQVSVYEELPEAGGFFRSARDGDMPTEYSWHGMGPWYHNFFDLLRQIRADDGTTLFDSALCRPIDFGMFPNQGRARFYDWRWLSIPGMFRMRGFDFAGWAWLMLKSWVSQRRSRERYAQDNAWQRWARVMSEPAARAWRACFGPWIGSDWTRVSLHTAGRFFMHQLTSAPAHRHQGWTHGAGDGWLLLRGPSSEVWFEPWVRRLRERGVSFYFEAPLRRLSPALEVEGHGEVRADYYVLAVNPFAVAELVRSAGVRERELSRFEGLCQEGHHSQVSFRLGFGQPIAFPRQRTAVVVADSPYDLTLFAQEQAWDDGVGLGQGVESLWTGTACVDSVPGVVHGLALRDCTREQFLDEVKAQVLACGSLDALVREANGGRGLADFPLVRAEVWHEWSFGPLRARQPKWVNTTHTQAHRPDQLTTLPNVFLAGAHTRTEVDVWSIEGAVESGRRAARGIDRRVRVLPQHRPWWLRALGWADDQCYRLGAPHLLDLLLAAALLQLTLTSVRAVVSLGGGSAASSSGQGRSSSISSGSTLTPIMNGPNSA